MNFKFQFIPVANPREIYGLQNPIMPTTSAQMPTYGLHSKNLSTSLNIKYIFLYKFISNLPLLIIIHNPNYCGAN